MRFHILIIEDCDGTRGILNGLLDPTTKTAASIESLPSWTLVGDVDFAIDTLEPQAIEDLVAAKSVEGVSDALERYFEMPSPRERVCPNLLVLDLALHPKEVEKLDAANGKEKAGINDPGEALANTTGFRILQAWHERCPVLVTTFAGNPHVVRRCLDAGAHDVIVKPLSDEEMTHYYGAWERRKSSVAQQDEVLVHDAQARVPQIETYVRCVAHEVLKAMRVIALKRLEGAAPANVPFWLAADATRIYPGALDGTNLMLVDVKGFSRMVHEGKSVPIAVFEIMNAIWAAVFAVLERHSAEVNNFMGDAALIFRGVYDSVRTQASIRDTLVCAREISELFEPEQQLRATLIEIVKSHYGELMDTESNAHKNMLDLIGGDSFGIRVISIEPDTREALYGKVGASHRWQHTILSRFMNFLARGESAIGSWEKKRTYQRRQGESFLLWRKDRSDQPAFDGFSFELPHEFLGKERGKIRDLPKDVEVYRVLPNGG